MAEASEQGRARAGTAAYRRVLAVPAVRSVLLLGFLIRIPIFAATVALTLHVVQTLHGTYAAAGFVTTCATVAAAISGPWRGRILDRVGLRRTLNPSIVAQVLCWAAAPWLGYWPLAVLAFVAGLFLVPTFSIIRQALFAVSEERDRRTVLSLDSSAAELTFMIGPALGVWLATSFDTRWVILLLEMLSAVGALAMWVMDPPLRRDGAPTGPAPVAVGAQRAGGSTAGPGRSWITPPVLAIFASAVATTIVLTGTDVGTVAALRSMGQPAAIGWCLALWGLGSLLGGLAYGALSRSIHVSWLLGALGALTIPVAVSVVPWHLAAILFVAGFACAPAITACVDQLTEAVPERSRGEAMGWHGSMMTAGSALGAPLAGVAIDRWGWEAGFVLVGAVGVVVAVAALGARRGVRRRRVRRSVEPAPAEALAPGAWSDPDAG